MIPEGEIFKMIFEGGAVAVVVYAFYMLLNNNLKGQKTYESNMKSLQERYIEDLKALQVTHIQTMAEERVLHRQEMRELAHDFTEGLRVMSENVAKLTHELQNLDHRVETLNDDARDVRDARDMRSARELKAGRESGRRREDPPYGE